MNRKIWRFEGHAVFATAAAHITLCAALSCFVAFSVLRDGIPGFRHDWTFAFGSDALVGSIEELWQPWMNSGIGSPYGYPTFYLSGFVLYSLHWIGTTGIAALIVTVSVFLAAEGAYHYARRVGSGVLAASAVASIAALNPWVYSEEVAGHNFMVLAYGLWLALIAEFLHPYRRRRLMVLCALAISQIEFFAVGVVPLLFALTRRREMRLASIVIVAALPIVVGIGGEYGAIRATPFLLPWQIGSSVEPSAAIVLRGYSMNYDTAFNSVAWALAPLAVVSLVGLATAYREALPRTICAVALLCFVLCTGVHGPLGVGYAWIVLHVPEIGLFRELYDLVAIIAIAYCIGLAQLCRRLRALEPVVAMLALALVVPWIEMPVAAHTVPLRDFHPTRTPAVPTERVVFLPAFQPVSFEGRGSGFDPDIVPRAGHAMSLNEFYPQYPVDRVLAQLNNTGLDAPAAALGATGVFVRPQLVTDSQTLALQAAYAVPRAYRNTTHRITDPWPILGIVPGPAIVSVGDDPRENAIAFADAGSPFELLARQKSPEPDRTVTDSRLGWIDARLTVRSHPEWATASGGVFTTSPAPLPVAADRGLLGAALGKLRDDAGHVIAGDAELRWRRLPARTSAVHCEGTCVVAAFGDPPPGIPAHGPFVEPTPLTWKWITAWFAVATLNAGDTGALRFAVRYDRWWVALDGPTTLRHVRLASALNGWILPTHHGNQLTLINVLAAMQFLAEAIAGTAVLACFLPWDRLRRRGADAGDNAANQRMLSERGIQRTFD